MPTDSKKIRRDAFVKSVRPNPDKPEEVTLLQGYIGDSDLAGNLRIYFDRSLSRFIDLPEKDVIHSCPVETTEDPMGGSRLWVKKSTVFTAGDPRHANRVKSTFLEGDLVRAFGAANPAAFIGARGINSHFVVGGCGVVTEMFEDCAPTGPGRPECQIFDPGPQRTFQSPSCTPTCPQAPCHPPSRHPFAVCISDVVRCEFATVNNCNYIPVGYRNPASLACAGGGGFYGGFNPYQT